MNYICSNCRTIYPAGPQAWRCAACGAHLEMETRAPFKAGAINRDDHTLWRYRAMLPVSDDEPIVSLGEGMTPLVAASFAGHTVHFKLEYMAPTGSFKDRGTTVLVSKLKGWGVQRAADDSSGNAGASFAAYAAHAGIAAEVYTPAYASPAKLAQIEIFGAKLNKIEGVREKATEAIENAVAGGLVYASHAWSPLTYEGTKTVAYEIWEQLGRRAPDVFMSPVGQGSLFLGAYRGFQDLLAAGLIAKLPRMIGVQSNACPPIVEAVRQGLDRHATIDKQPSVAEGISLAHPIRDRDVLQAIRDTGGTAIGVDDSETLAARDELARTGLYVEPTSAVVGAALKRAGLSGIVVAALSGSGLKSPPK
ncbi:MAG: pyridoxal-phosphate dependent enzyme [Chloroflexi bacterium]|nr:pyridoxal-phosphate dependent enzyme [Chloroflexota bacterium]